ncbi:MAG: DEAD/DEAH box helicase family protein [Planctomycetota bacterium]
MPDDPQTIAEAEARLEALERERRRTLATLERLRARATRGTDEGDRLAGLMAPAEKLALFRRFFRGRDDLYPRLWENRRTGKKGYAPACANEWVQGVCEKPRVRCGACPSRAFLPLDDDVLLGHLRGQHVVGIYPLLSDETCWLLAADFDERTWRDDVRSFRDTCRDAGLAVTLERSRSGNGAHAWMFFAEPVAAAVARRMGCALLTATMSRRHAMSLASYDRLFPSQDTMPTGGFGNLIALPLQYEARKQGNTMFLDDDLEPLEDPWAYLRDLQSTPREMVEEIAARAAREGRIVGLPLPSCDDEEEASPWTRSPSRARRRAKIEGPLPTRVKAVASQRLFVEKAGLPSPLLNEIKRLAAFQNPQFYERQGMRLSTALTPRVIGCAEESALHIGLPRGCAESLGSLLGELGVELEVADERTEGDPLDVKFEGRLTALQQRAVAALLAHDHGVVVAPPGAGKTVLGIHLIARRARNTLVLVHRKPLLDQWRAQLALFLGVAPKSIGRIGAGASRANGRLDVAMIQSLCRKGQVSDVVAQYGHVVVDECHHVSAVSFERVLAETKARFVTGLTATLRRRDGHDPVVTMQCGPVRFRADARDAGAVPSFPRWLHVQDTAFRVDPGIPTPGIQQALWPARRGSCAQRGSSCTTSWLHRRGPGASRADRAARPLGPAGRAPAAGGTGAGDLARRAEGAPAQGGDGAARRAAVRGAARGAGDGTLRGRGVRRSPARHPPSGLARLVARHLDPVRGTPPPSSCRQDGGPDLRLCRPFRTCPAAHVRAPRARLPVHGVPRLGHGDGDPARRGLEGRADASGTCAAEDAPGSQGRRSRRPVAAGAVGTGTRPSGSR